MNENTRELGGMFAEVLITLIFVIILVWLGWVVSRWACRAAAHQQRDKYPTEQFLELTYQEPPPQWPPAPTVEPPGG